MIFRISICLLLSTFDVVCVLPEIRVGMLISWTSTDVAAQRFAGAITRVLDDINNSTEILNGTKMTYIQADPSCNDRDGLGATVTLFNKNVDVFIGPPCSKSCLSGGLLSSYEKIPMISFGCSSNELSNKANYPYFARTKPFARTSSTFTPNTFVQLLYFFKWRHLCLIESASDIYSPISQRVYEKLNANGNLSVVYEKYYPDYIEYNGKKNILVALQKKCRSKNFLMLAIFNSNCDVFNRDGISATALSQRLNRDGFIAMALLRWFFLYCFDSFSLDNKNIFMLLIPIVRNQFV